MRSNYKKIGELIHLVDERNKGLKISKLVGLSISKQFIPSVANIVGTDMENYKVIRKKQFACSLMQVRRDKKMPVALLQDFDEAIISQAYPVFEVNDEKELLPEYLMMWFSRSEFDRQACFYAVGGVRGSLEWEDFGNMELPVPDITKQQEIVDEYNTIKNRISLNNTLIEKLEDTAQAIYKQWFVDFEFPNEEGKPYKSSGGEMEYCEEFIKDIPKGWRVEILDDISGIKAGGDKPAVFSEEKNELCQIPIYSNGVTNEGLYGYTNKANYPKNSITISARGTIGYSVLRREEFDAIVRLLVITPNNDYYGIYLWQSVRLMDFCDSGSVQKQLTKPHVSALDILFPVSDILKHYNSILKPVYKKSFGLQDEKKKLYELEGILLSKIAIID